MGLSCVVGVVFVGFSCCRLRMFVNVLISFVGFFVMWLSSLFGMGVVWCLFCVFMYPVCFWPLFSMCSSVCGV